MGIFIKHILISNLSERCGCGFKTIEIMRFEEEE